MKVHKIEQGSDDWFDCRKGKLTGSHSQAIAVAGKGLDTYILEVMANVYAETREESYTNEAMQRGNEQEAMARDEYSFQKEVIVEEVGFIERNEFIGTSPDGLVGKDGGIEIKSHNHKVFFKLLLDREIDKKYWWQIQMNLLISERKWWDYVGYNPSFKEKIIVIRVLPDQEAFKKLEKGFVIGIKRIIKITKQLNKKV